jgi:uncharacterized caspase-like protein
MDRNAAYVNVLAMARTASEFHDAAAAAFRNIGFEVVELEDPEPLARRLEASEVDATLIALAHEVESSGQPRFGSFHTWTAEDEDPG